MHPSDEGDDCAAASMEMPRYVSHKKVWALEIAEVIEAPLPTSNRPNPTRRVSFKEPGYATIGLPDEMFLRYIPVSGDFYVQYADGYKSFSPRKAFLDGYRPVERGE